MRFRLFARKWRARRRAAAEGAMPVLAEPDIRPPVTVGSHRRPGPFRMPRRDLADRNGAPGGRAAAPRRPSPRQSPLSQSGSGPAFSGRSPAGRPRTGPASPGPATAPGGPPAPPEAPAWAGGPAATSGRGAGAGSRAPRTGPSGLVPPPRAGGGRGTSDPGGPTSSAAPRPGPARPGAGRADHRRWGGIARAAIRTAAPAAAARAPSSVRSAAQAQAHAQPPAQAQAQPKVAWYEIAEGNRTAAGWRDCGSLEKVLHREWAAAEAPPAEAVTAINRLADLPRLIKDRLVGGLDAIHVGGGGVPDLDDMGRLSGVPLPSGRATWDACAGAYGERKIVVGSRPSPTPDVMCHEVGHALDDIDGPPGHWQSDSDEFCALYDQCSPHLVSNLHRQRGILGRREFFADAFAAIASRQRPALVDMLGGDTRTALNVMLYFNMRYGI
jgi:hypothetical protein